ncbi:MAG: uracil-DNA glycosylase family protein [Bacteroidetes bacterium]|nr:MAG: uracil-DNA glycosylase family protein [Bacteroidota bacterium]
MEELLEEIRACTLCAENLPLGPRPVLRASVSSRILIIGQAPGTKVHASGIPWDDQSGKNLRAWMGVEPEEFYNPELFAIIPMGFCYPGKGKSGDLPPRKECAPQWHEKLLSALPHVQLTLLIGQYAQDYYLPQAKALSLTEKVKNFEAYLPNFFPLVHPSPRNQIWQKRNPWFQAELIPKLQTRIQTIIS